MTDHDKKLAINYEQFEKEIHVAHIVKTLRTLKSFVKSKTGQAEWNRIYNRQSVLAEHISDNIVGDGEAPSPFHFTDNEADSENDTD